MAFLPDRYPGKDAVSRFSRCAVGIQVAFQAPGKMDDGQIRFDIPDVDTIGVQDAILKHHRMTVLMVIDGRGFPSKPCAGYIDKVDVIGEYRTHGVDVVGVPAAFEGRRQGL